MSQRPRTASALRPSARGAAALVLGVAAAILTACGGSDSGGSAAGTTTATTPAETSGSATDSGSATGGSAQAQSLNATETNGHIELDRQDLTGGDYTIQVVNNGSATHDLVVEQNGQVIARSEMLSPGASGTVSVTLAPGEYVFYCSVGNHRAMGMELPVTVQ